MIVWLALILFLILLKLYMGDLTDKQMQKKFLIISGIAITLVMGLRYPAYEIVYDLRIYYNFYDKIITTPWMEIFTIDRFEPGYVILNKVLSTIVPWPQFILLFEALFCVYAVSRFIYRNSEYPFQGILFYVCLGVMGFHLTAFRQAFAMSICLLSIELIKERKFFKFLLAILLAMSFHKTALVFLPFYFLANRKLTRGNNMISFLVIVISPFLAKIFTIIGNRLFDMQYSGYIGNALGGLIQIIIYIIAILLSLRYSKRTQEYILYNMIIIGLAIYLMRYSTIMLERLSFFYNSVIIVQLPNVINMERNKATKALFKYGSIILAIILFIYRLTYAEYGDYRFFWQ